MSALSAAILLASCAVETAPATPDVRVDESLTGAAVMPDLLCMDLNDAQSAAGVDTRSEDATGDGRRQIVDSNWIVIATDPEAGEPINEKPTLFTVKDGEVALHAPGCLEPAEATTTAATTTSQATAATEQSTSTVSTATTTTTTVSASNAVRQDAQASLASAELTSSTPVAPYDRDEYQPSGWPDSDGDCQNDRHEVLIDESLEEVALDPTGCFVETGMWVDPYDGVTYTQASDVSIDHVISLSHAHRNGASSWDLTTKQAFASDIAFPGSLVVTGAASNQSKSDLSPADWRPPSEAAWCSFALDWVHGKQRWQLTYESEAERSVLDEMLETCSVSSPPRLDQANEAVLIASIATSTTTTSTTTTIVPEGSATARIVSCLRRPELVTIANDGATALSLRGYVLHDEESRHSFSLPGNISIGPGETLTIATGPDAESGPVQIVWKRQNVWNNDGDTAFLISQDGDEISLRCS